jgi:hypothetical protein
MGAGTRGSVMDGVGGIAERSMGIFGFCFAGPQLKAGRRRMISAKT